MGKGKSKTKSDKCKRYFEQRRRIKNKTHRQNKMLAELEKTNPKAAEKIRKHDIIGRKKEKAGRYA